ncbi:phosphate regulon sensor protein PhoR, partial [Burkholderia multivorans]
MNIIWARFLVSLVLLVLISVLVGVFAGPTAGFGFAAAMLIVQGFFSTFHTQRLWRLLDAPVYGEVPSAPGIWG